MLGIEKNFMFLKICFLENKKTVILEAFKGKKAG